MPFVDDRKHRRRKSEPLKGPYGALPTVPPPPPPARRRRRKTVKLWKDQAAVERGKRGAATRKAKKAQQAAQSEHERRSQAARKGWAKIPKDERTERAIRGWDTRYAQSGRSRSEREHRQRLEDAGRKTRHQLYGNSRTRPRSGPYAGDPRLPGWEFLRDRRGGAHG